MGQAFLEQVRLNKDASEEQVMSRQFTDRFIDQFTDRALGIRAEEDSLLLFLALDIDPSPCPKFCPIPCPIFIT